MTQLTVKDIIEHLEKRIAEQRIQILEHKVDHPEHPELAETVQIARQTNRRLLMWIKCRKKSGQEVN